MNMFPFPILGFLGGSMSGGEILIIMLAMLLLFGSKKLPSMARNLGKSIETFRRASREVTEEIMRADLDDDAKKKPAVSGAEKNDTDAGDSAEKPVIKSSVQAVGRHESRSS